MTTAAEANPFQTFRAISCVALGGLIGALIGAPAAASAQPPAAQIIVAAAIALGIFTGYRRRRSPAFFYFALIAACVLAGLLAFSGLQPQAGAPQ